MLVSCLLMRLALDLAFLGDVMATLFAAFLFLVSGLAIGFMLGRRRYLTPLIEIESELRRTRNEELRRKFFGSRPADSDTRGSFDSVAAEEPDSRGAEEPMEKSHINKSTSSENENKIDSNPVSEPLNDSSSIGNEEALIRELRIELEERRIESTLLREEHTQDLRMLNDEVFELRRKVKHLRGDSVDVAEAQVVEEDIPVRMDRRLPDTPDTPDAAGHHTEPDMTGETGTTDDESLLDTVSVWTQKLFSILEPDPPGTSDPGPDPSVDNFADDDTTHDTDLPAFEPLATLLTRRSIERHANDTPAQIFSLSITQKSILKDMGFNSFGKIAILDPIDIIRVATAVNVPISDIENIWLPLARSRSATAENAI